METQTEKDPKIYEAALSRTRFKIHLSVFMIITLFLWIIWLFLGFLNGYAHPWPVYPMGAWILAIIFHYLQVYKWKTKWVEAEYEKIVNKNNNIQEP